MKYLVDIISVSTYLFYKANYFNFTSPKIACGHPYNQSALYSQTINNKCDLRIVLNLEMILFVLLMR